MNQKRPPISIEWITEKHFKIGDTSFILSVDTAELQSSKSGDRTFLLGKKRSMVEDAIQLGQVRSLNKVFEMGILQGGSVALYDKIWNPEKLVAIEYTNDRISTLDEYIESHNRQLSVKPYFSVNQADRAAMEDILDTEFPAQDIDYIIDDASHLYKETRKAFNIAFPYLRAGGLYCIEDWAWAHWEGSYWQDGGNEFLRGKTSMSNLIVELMIASASSPALIRSVHIEHSTVVVTKGDTHVVPGDFDIGDHCLMRGKPFNPWI